MEDLSSLPFLEQTSAKVTGIGGHFGNN